MDKICGRLSGEVNAAQVKIVTDPAEVGHATYVVEAVIENHGAKADLLASLHRELAAEAVLATTTSSLSIEQARRGQRAARALRADCTSSTRYRG